MRTIAVLRPAVWCAVSSIALMLAACNGKEPSDQVSVVPSGEGTEAVSDTPDADPSDVASSSAATSLDTGALVERRDPERLLRYYTNAVRAGDWTSAAKAWSLDAQMTPEKLINEFGVNTRPKLAVGKGDVEGAAGSLYYEAPVVVDFGDGRIAKRGTIVLSRVNDVPGASEEQLNWRIERTSTLVQE